MEASVKPGTLCECRDDGCCRRDALCKRTHRAPQGEVYCRAEAVCMVMVRERVETSGQCIDGVNRPPIAVNVSQRVPMCTPCASWHESKGGK